MFNYFDPPEKEVLINPNLLGGFPPEQHVTTHPSLVRAIVTYCEKRKVSITVGDNPAGRGNMVGRAKKSGLFEASQGHFRDISEGVDVTVDSKFFSKLVVSKKVLHSSYLLNAPKFKIHLQTIITGLSRTCLVSYRGGEINDPCQCSFTGKLFQGIGGHI